MRVLDGLHAKIFLGGSSAVVGSANASRNSLGRPGMPPVLREAGVRFDSDGDPEAFAEIERIYDRCVAASRAVDRDDFDRAATVVLNPAARDEHPDDRNEAASVLEALSDDPRPFARASFIFGDHPIEKEDLEDAEKAFRGETGESARDGGRSHICSIDEEETTGRPLRSASLIVMFWLGRNPGIWAFHDIRRVEHDEGVVSYFGRRHWGVVSRALGMTRTGSRQAWERDRPTAALLADLHGEHEGERFVALTAHRTLERIEAGRRGDR